MPDAAIATPVSQTDERSDVCKCKPRGMESAGATNEVTGPLVPDQKRCVRGDWFLAFKTAEFKLFGIGK